jgi:hypothetical protein
MSLGPLVKDVLPQATRLWVILTRHKWKPSTESYKKGDLNKGYQGTIVVNLIGCESYPRLECTRRLLVTTVQYDTVPS